MINHAIIFFFLIFNLYLHEAYGEQAVHLGPTTRAEGRHQGRDFGCTSSPKTLKISRGPTATAPGRDSSHTSSPELSRVVRPGPTQTARQQKGGAPKKKASYFLLRALANVYRSLRTPTIRIRRGHLVLTAARDKNISLETTGSGGLHLNGEDVFQIFNLVKTTAQSVHLLTGSSASSSSDDGSRHADIEGILKRINTIEGNTQNVSLIATNRFQRKMIYMLSRRLIFVQNNVRKVMTLLSYDECQTNPCLNGGTCRDLFNAYLCLCPGQWEGSTCNIDVDECARFSGTDLGCQNGATCINKRGGYECVCSPGWVGIHCTRRTADCNTAGRELCDHGTCISAANTYGYKCLCDEGWTTDGKNPACSADVDECGSKKLPCSTNPLVPCINVPGSFYCGNCPPGYTGNGYYCTDVDECALFNGGCSMNPTVQCINTQGSRSCGPCPPGYLGNGLTCSYQGGVCAVNNGGCHPLAQCRDNSQISSSYVECLCPRGYAGSGFGSSGCIRTEYEDPCQTNPCIHGNCSVNTYNNDYFCECGTRFTGRNCDIMKDPCKPNPCLNNGSCSLVLDISYRCICPNRYFGYNCENEKRVCGDTMEGSEGTFEYPVGRYVNYNNCIWRIKTEQGKLLKLMFTEFDFEDSHQCQASSLTILDSVSQVIRRMCGKTLVNITSPTNEVQLWLRLNYTAHISRFKLNWTSIAPSCGGSIIATSHGTIKSPGSPSNYPANTECYWMLQATLDKRIVFHFYSLVIGNNSDCNKDYLEFYSDSIKNKPFAKYCNTSNPEPLHSETSNVIVHFHSDATGAYPGFQVVYSLISGIPGCGGTYTQESGSIFSPSNLPPYATCEYKIKLQSDAKIKIEFLTFDVAGTSDCSHAHLAIYEGSSVNSPLIGRYCGTAIPAPYISLSNEIFIFYESGSSKGFILQYSTVCREKFTADRGVIQSVNYPQLTLTELTCTYEIIQPQGTTVTLNIIDLTMDSNNTRNFLEISEGGYDKREYMGRYTSQTYPLQIISKFNYLRITVKQSREFAAKYYLNYTTTDTGCGGILTSSETDQIQTPPFSRLYSDALSCTWFILAPKNHVIMLEWSNFNIFNCSHSRVTVYNVEEQRDNLIGTYCKSSRAPPTVISSGDILKIMYEKQSETALVTEESADSFLATFDFVYAPTVCGGDYYTSSGIIKTPEHSSTFQYIKCEWTIKVPPGMQIMLTVKNNTLQNESSCNEYLEIRNGASLQSPFIGKYCNNIKPPSITSHANTLHLMTRTRARKANGITISWESAATGCGGLLTSSEGVIGSPNYPGEPPQLTECYWKVTVNAGSILRFEFTDLDVQSSTCLDNYIEIFDGPFFNSPSLGKFCSKYHFASINTTSENALVKFVTNNTVNGRGFLLNYTQVCNVNFTRPYGVIESPNFPNTDEFGVDCTWNILAPKGNTINITFTDFDVRLGPKSNYTKNCVEIIYIDPSSKDLQDEKFCIENPQFLSIKSNEVEIHFENTENFSNNLVFRLEWVVVGCLEKFTHPKGEIKSPNYPNPYPASTECEWLIQADYGSRVIIEFEELDIDLSSNECFTDFIKVYNGPDKTYPVLSTMCHTDKSTVLTSSGNSMLVTFQSDESFEGRGFKANYSVTPTACGGLLRAKNGSFHSPNYPQNFSPWDNCEWLIEVEESYAIELNFIDVDLINNCTEYYIKVYDGPSSTSSELTKICNDNGGEYKTIQSTYNYLLVEMHTGQSGASKGFIARFNTRCGATLNKVSGLIKSKKSDSLCQWTITAERPDQHASVTFTAFESMSCQNDLQISVYNGLSRSSPLIGSYCGKIPPTITSSGSALHIVAYNGFRASYTTFGSGCGGTLQNEKGYFASPGYPGDYPTNTECEWIIAASNSITITFSMFDLVESAHCNEDFLEFRERDYAGKLLGNFCGSNAPTNLTHIGPLWVMFKSSKLEMNSGVNTARGFMAEYSLSSKTELVGPSGQIQSPLYPYFFVTEKKYSWRIIVDFRHKILLKFNDLDFSYGNVECMALMSPLKIYDGYDETAPELINICNKYSPKVYETVSNVVFVTCCDNEFLKVKFSLSWEQIEIAAPTVIPVQQAECGSSEIIDMTLTPNYTFTSPGYPYGYSYSLNCTWQFVTLQNQHLSVLFTEMDLYNYGTSCYDAVKLFKRNDELNDWDLVRSFCLPNDTFYEVEASNSIKVEFTTSYGVNQTGFSAVVYSKCGGDIKDAFGVIRLSKSVYHKNYSLSCQWNITARPGRMIEIQFRKLGWRSNLQSVCHNYVLLRNGQYADSPLLGKGKYCLDNLPAGALRTTGYHLYITLILESKIILPLVLLEYKEVTTDCRNRISLSKDLNTTKISSPNYPSIPTPHSECTWVITAPQGETVSINFNEPFDLVDGSNCMSEYVEVREGATAGSPLKGRWCGGNPPSTQILYSNVMFVRYFTDVQNPRNGFSATVSLADCGGIIYAAAGELNSVDYIKQSVKKSADCSWRIVGPTAHVLTLTFTSLKFGQYNCTTNYVRVHGFYSYCSQMPSYLFMPRNYATIKYKTENRQATSFSLKFSSSLRECGEELVHGIGYIFSPSYGTISSNYCEWTITVPQDRRIKIKLVQLQFLSGLPSYKQELSFYDGEQLILTLHDGDTVRLINSTGNRMKITFKNDVPRSGVFILFYTSNESSLCEGDFNQNSGVIAAPTEQPIFSCIWTRSRSPPANQTLSMNINATVTSVKQINITAGSKDTVLTNIWTNLTTVRTPYLITEITVAKSREQSPLNFTASYKTYPCGGIITDSSGHISSPKGTSPGARFECVWVINPPEDQNIKVDFTFMDLGDDCDSNYIVIRNGVLQSDPKIGTYCARSPPQNLLSQSNALWIEYQSVNATGDKGFNLTFESITSGCGGILHDYTQLIQTPSYPSDYPNNAECVWELHADSGYHINLEFTDRFHLEMSTGCKNDFVQIWDYVDNEWVSVQKLCGRERPGIFNSTSNKIKIMFRSNEITSGSGFKARWGLECGGNLVAEEKIKYIVSPGYPVTYGNDLNCVYNISAHDRNIHIVFLDFNLEQSIACRYDNLTVNSDYFQYPMTAKTYCGNKLPNPLIIFKSVFLTLRTDSFQTKPGFKFSYQIYDCGENITKPTVLVSPVMVQRKIYVHEYITCQWNITAPQNQIAVVRFESFTLAYDAYCSTNQVGLYEGFNATQDNRLVLLCGNLTNNLPIIRSQGNKMALQYGSYPQIIPSSFKAMIYFSYGPSVGCGGNISLGNESTYILKGPKGLSFVDCHWQIQGVDGFVLKLTFLEKITCRTNATKIHNVKTCKCSKFEIRDGGGSFSQLMSEICDDNPSTTYTTSSPRAWIRWTTNGFTGDKFFRLQILAIPTICGENVLNATTTAQYLTSPNYPHQYPANTKCTWSIKGENYAYVHLRFMKFDLGYGDSAKTCESDRVDVGDKSHTMGFSDSLGSNAIYAVQGLTDIYEYSDQQIGVHQYCGSTTEEFEYYSLQNEVIVTFYSGTGNHGQGFKLQYEVTGCSQNYTTVQGRLLTANYPYPTNCTISIVTPANTTISLYFSSFYIPSSSSDVCAINAKLEIFDGGTNKSPSLGTFCGYDVPNPVFTTQNKLLFHLVNSDSSYINYDIIFTSTSEGRGCGGTIYNYRGVFTSPMYPNNFRNDSKCVWEIYVPSNFNSAIKFRTFNLLSPCKTDYVIVTTYEEGQGNEHRYCTNDNPPVLYSSNRITITYKTSVHNGGSGWMAQFTALTDGA